MNADFVHQYSLTVPPLNIISRSEISLDVLNPPERRSVPNLSTE